MNILVCYDVSTTTAEGRRRLRQVAQTCLDFGQRVQFSVFECRVSDARLLLLRSRLLDIIAPAEDSLRIYHLGSSREVAVESFGKDRYQDFDAPLLI